MQTSTDARALEAAGNGLVALSRTPNAEQIKRIEDELFGVLETTKEHRTLQAAGNFLLTLVPDLTPETRI